MKKPYCTQNNGDCSTCSLVSYNRDCRNNPVQGGRRKGAGRPPTGRKKANIYVTEQEEKLVREYIAKLRKTGEEQK